MFSASLMRQNAPMVGGSITNDPSNLWFPTGLIGSGVDIRQVIVTRYRDRMSTKVLARCGCCEVEAHSPLFIVWSLAVQWLNITGVTVQHNGHEDDENDGDESNDNEGSCDRDAKANPAGPRLESSLEFRGPRRRGNRRGDCRWVGSAEGGTSASPHY